MNFWACARPVLVLVLIDEIGLRFQLCSWNLMTETAVCTFALLGGKSYQPRISITYGSACITTAGSF